MSTEEAAAANKMITLVSSDGDRFEVEETVAKQSQTIRSMIEDGCADSPIPLPNVTSKALAKVIEYCNRHAGNDNDKDDDLKTFDKEFVNEEQPVLFELILAANYLNIKSLLDVTCQSVADMIKDNTVEQVRKTFNIVNDFTAEEEAEVRKENAWAFE